MLEELAQKLANYFLVNALSLNRGKLQVMWMVAFSPPLSIIGGISVAPWELLQVLGLTLDPKLTLCPHLRGLVGAAWSLLALTRRLLVHLPRGHHVQEVVCSLVRGKLCYCFFLFPHRLTEEKPICQHLHTAEVQINDIACLIFLGVSRVYRTSVSVLTSRSGLPSLLTRTQFWSLLLRSGSPCTPLMAPMVLVTTLALSSPLPSQPLLNRVARSWTAGGGTPVLQRCLERCKDLQ